MSKQNLCKIFLYWLNFYYLHNPYRRFTLCKRVLAQNMSITHQQPVLCHTLNSVFLINGLRESCQVKCLHTCPADSAGVGLSLHKAQLEALICKTGTTKCSEVTCQGPVFQHVFIRTRLWISIKLGSKLWNQKPDSWQLNTPRWLNAPRWKWSQLRNWGVGYVFGTLGLHSCCKLTCLARDFPGLFVKYITSPRNEGKPQWNKARQLF